MRVCGACKKINADADTLCERCGKPLVSPVKKEAKEANVKFCAKCMDKTYPFEQQTCPNCHSKLQMSLGDSNGREDEETPANGGKPVFLVLRIFVLGISAWVGSSTGSIWKGALFCGVVMMVLFLIQAAVTPRASGSPYRPQESFQWTCPHCGIMNEGAGTNCSFCGKRKN